MKGIAVRLEGLAKHFGKVIALQALDLEIRAGEMVAFLGPSGCGKTTTLLMIAGVYQPTAGAIYFAERRVDHLHPRERDVGMVFQSYALYPHLTLFENIAFPLRLKGLRGEALAAKVRQTAELLGIAHLLERRPGQVSGGQQQRAALARALVKEPQVLLLDEPLSNLDAQVRVQARGEIRRLQLDLGVTSILVTHDQAEALAMADRVAVFSTGLLQQFAPPDELYTRPANLFVAGFVGHP
ncbi:MAG TPA: ABC transporter ATP-binding protein, partial [bacterium]|nr:ABC transporter ATP-binding protein [bacterium]